MEVVEAPYFVGLKKRRSKKTQNRDIFYPDDILVLDPSV